MLQQRCEDFSEILILSFCVYDDDVFYIYSTSTFSYFACFSYSGLILVLTRFLVCSYCYSRCGRLSSYSLSKGRLLYSFIFVHISYIFIFRSQATFVLEESSETILLFVDSGGSEVGHVPLDVTKERVCCLLVLNSVTSTPQWIRQPEAAWGCVWCVCVSMYSDVLGSLSL